MRSFKGRMGVNEVLSRRGYWQRRSHEGREKPGSVARGEAAWKTGASR